MASTALFNNLVMRLLTNMTILAFYTYFLCFLRLWARYLPSMFSDFPERQYMVMAYLQVVSSDSSTFLRESNSLTTTWSLFILCAPLWLDPRNVPFVICIWILIWVPIFIWCFWNLLISEISVYSSIFFSMILGHVDVINMVIIPLIFFQVLCLVSQLSPGEEPYRRFFVFRRLSLGWPLHCFHVDRSHIGCILISLAFQLPMLW